MTKENVEQEEIEAVSFTWFLI